MFRALHPRVYALRQALLKHPERNQTTKMREQSKLTYRVKSIILPV